MFSLKRIKSNYFFSFYIIFFLLIPTFPALAQDDSSTMIEGDLMGQGYLKIYSIKFLDNPIIIKKESFPIIDSIATILLKNPRVRVEVASYAETNGNEIDKSKIEKEVQKAKAVCNHLAYKGVTETRFTCKGYTFQKLNETTEPITDSTFSDTSKTENTGTTTGINDSATTDSTNNNNKQLPVEPQQPKHTAIVRPRIEFRIISR